VSSIRMFKNKPLTGFGPGTYQFTYIPYQDESLKNRLTVTNPWDIPENSGGTAHSEYLLAMSEMGILGIMAWLILLSRWIYISFNLNVLPMYRKNIVAAFVALSTYMFHGVFNNFLNTDKVAFLFWATAAWLTVNYHLSNEQRVLQKS
jgi:putative inorganic carbon (hco3(-)) transporter